MFLKKNYKLITVLVALLFQTSSYAAKIGIIFSSIKEQRYLVERDLFKKILHKNGHQLFFKSSSNDLYIAHDHFQVGKLQAEAVLDFLKKKKKY